jgi:crotonobetainyl-CoA:carnitine CoA-transferase CaiB-like acyl-CoA transferase
MQSLAGVRIVEVAEMVGGPYATKLLADLGAEVIKVEPRAGDRSRHVGPFPANADGDSEQSGLFLGLNTNKRSVVLDLDESAGRARLADLVAEADVVVHDLRAARAAEVGLDGDELLARHPGLVVTAITPFGLTGPQADWAGDELAVVHGGGWGFLIPGDDPDPTRPPLTVPGWFAHCHAGMAAALATLGAAHKATATGVGEFIDHSVLATVSAMLEASFIAWSYAGNIAKRNDGRILTPWRILRCSDGLIFLVTVEQDQWERLVEMMGTPEWATMGIFDTIEDRAANQDVLNMYLEEWTSQHTVDELWHAGQARRICFAPVFTMPDLARQPHLRERGFFHTVEHPVAGELEHLGAPYVMEPTSWALRTGAPMLGADNDATFTPRSSERPAPDLDARAAKPLAGVRVIDFSWVWAGPYCTMHLAYLGADVIKIESSTRPGLGRRLPIHPQDMEPTLNTCGYFNQWDQGKRSVELDLTDPSSIETVLALVADADVVVDNYATGVMERLGLGDEVLRAANPDIILASVTGYGHTGPHREYMGYGPTTCPLSGIAAMTGHPGEPPMEAGLSVGDPAAGLTAAFAIVASLFANQGTRIDVSLWESTAVNGIHAWMAHALGHEPDGPQGSRSFAASPHGVFRAAGDDDWVSIACLDDQQWQAFAAILGVNDDRFATLAGRKANEVDLEAIVSEWTAARERWAITEELQAAGIAAYPSLRCDELEANPQHVARDFWERFDHPEVGQRTHSGVPWRTRNWPNGVAQRAPLIGEHTAEVLAVSDA